MSKKNRVVSRNTGSVPLIGSEVIRERASGKSVWSKKGSRICPTLEPEQSCIRSEADQTPEWSEKAPLLFRKTGTRRYQTGPGQPVLVYLNNLKITTRN